MTQVNWSQDIFSRGELSPLLYSRITVSAYYNGLMRAKNVITFPQGAAGKRFGTIYQNEITGITTANEISFFTFQYLNECVYVLAFIPDNILIYLEGILVATVTSTGIVASEIQNIDTTTLDARYLVASSLFSPKDLRRAAASANVISGVGATTITLTTPVTAGLIVPVRFTTSGALPTTSPQIRKDKTYFLYTVTTTTAEIYTTAQEAKARLTPYTISGAGSGTNNAFILNTWSFSTVAFRNLPVFDFTGGYDAITFTPGAVTGFGITLTASAPIFSTAYVGGAFVGNGGIARIATYVDTTHVTINISTNFDSTAAIPGITALLAEPAWSIPRGWPTKCSSFQSRSVFANTELLPNGIWLSVINDFDDFNGLEQDDDNAISWFPTSDNVNYIRFIVPYRSLTIHTNTGIYSTPLSNESAVTPKTFSMSLQDSSPATAVQPRAIDNQIVVMSGNDVHSLLWDGFNSSYTSTIASVANEHLIRTPVDECPFLDLQRAGSRYIFIINADGTMTVFQTLIAENVQGFTPAVLEQSYGNAYFRWAASSTDGRAWFVTERQIAGAASPIALTGNTDDTFTATASNFSTTDATLCQFTTSGVLPVTEPKIETGVYYWAIGVTANTFKVYLTKEDALADEGALLIENFGTTSNVVPWPLATKFYIEELSFAMKMDCCVVHSGAPTSTVTAARFNGQEVLINGDGYGYSAQGISNTITLEAHGMTRDASEIQAGFPITVEIETLPAAPPGAAGPKSSSFVYASHVRNAVCMFVDTIGGFVNGQPITMKTLNQIQPGYPPEPTTGSMQLSVMKGWSDFLFPAIDIIHTEPFDIKLTGLFYKIEV